MHVMLHEGLLQRRQREPMANFNSWDSYFYPPPHSTAMRNIADIRDPDGLRVYEYKVTGRRHRQLKTTPDLVEHTYDDAHVRAIHRYLFQDVYEWAGQYRTVNISKGMTDFADVATGQIDRGT